MKRIISLIITLLFIHQINAQDPNDCVNAITVCGNGVFESNASGIGNIQEVSGCSGFEHNSIWLKINIVQSGTLGFDLIPNDPAISVDYDFWVYGPNANCSALGSPIRCNTSNPGQSNSPNNHTGMYASSTQTQSFPTQPAYIRWLNVTAGQSYYIAIDRPVGDGGFQLQWTGSATAGTGAFPTPPTANSIPDYVTCSSTANIGIFDLNSVRTSINSDTTNNTISFYTTIANAVDNVNALPDIYSNASNPQTLYVVVKDNTSLCYSLTEFNLVVSTLPTASFTVSNTTICNGESVNLNFTGTPGAIVQYTIDNGTAQSITLDSTGNFTLTETPLLDAIYKLTTIKIVDGSGATICSDSINQTNTVTVNPLPTATISGNTSVCSGETATLLFSGTPDAIVTYTIDGGASQTITLDNTGNASLVTNALTATTTYTLVSVATANAPICTQNQTGAVVITVNNLPTVTISGTTTVCFGNAAIISFTGTPNAVVTYTIDGGTNQTVSLDATGNAY